MRAMVEINEYMAAHGRAPRGDGLWAFRLERAGKQIGRDDETTRIGRWGNGLFWFTGTYAEAKARAVFEARMLGADTVTVCS